MKKLLSLLLVAALLCFLNGVDSGSDKGSYAAVQNTLHLLLQGFQQLGVGFGTVDRGTDAGGIGAALGCYHKGGAAAVAAGNVTDQNGGSDEKADTSGQNDQPEIPQQHTSNAQGFQLG